MWLVRFVQNHLDADSSFQVHYTNYLTNLAQQWTRLYTIPKCVTELLREDSELLEKCLRQIRPFFCMSAGAVKGRVVLVRVSSQSLLKRVFVNLSHNKISMHVILLKCGLSVHCMQISSPFFYTSNILMNGVFKKWKPLGASHELTFAGSGRNVDIKGGLGSVGISLLPTRRIRPRISGLDFLRIWESKKEIDNIERCLSRGMHSCTHTHTHVGFYGLRGLSIGVMVFILYKLYVLLPYTYPTPKLSPHRRRCIYIFPQKNSLCMIYKRFKLWGHWKCPHKSPSPCNTCVIPMSLYKFVSS